MLLILGPKRCGKSTFMLWFMKHVIGKDYGYNAENIDSLIERFTGHLNNKLLIHVKELMGGRDRDLYLKDC